MSGPTVAELRRELADARRAREAAGEDAAAWVAASVRVRVLTERLSAAVAEQPAAPAVRPVRVSSLAPATGPRRSAARPSAWRAPASGAWGRGPRWRPWHGFAVVVLVVVLVLVVDEAARDAVGLMAGALLVGLGAAVATGSGRPRRRRRRMR